MESSLTRILIALAFPFTQEFWKVHGVSFTLSSTFIVLLWYYLVNKHNTDQNKMRCVFQYISSAIISFICWPVVIDLWFKYFQFEMDMLKWLQYDSYGYYKFMLNLFLSSLLFDLIFGVLYFRKQMFILNGWIHHTAYIILTLYIMRWKSYNILLVALPEEIPTYFISIYVIFPHNNRKFSQKMFFITFFIFRISYHIIGYSLLFLRASNREATQLWIPTSLTIFAHCYWYLLWLRKHWRSLFHSEEIPYSKENISTAKSNPDKEYNCIDYFDHYSNIEREI
ncbi:hypothetical protein [Cryptosporidium parvum Iowa II]|uniref:TLC domain-containing protein n=2 Tax=Cryptosporidium parvum TaxID=5807 RepID=Q5CQK6_CRYPI|nr:hypothetical protein [Cryptosporidium parvum Iowa II]EAK87680.1 hypothetical protein cgd4_350 [Cryptosporidium parvum Iowa II]QOY41924.1 Uncharacterized protein CPATCC_0017470 [Cryptosporidium parvum]WKS77227.1 transmembrane domain-containing protein [Cryptosporidium sp. 43IA8]WRK32104.1 Uncharacterized protein cpbgf_400350 [Cryptosporidium parvum]|eukprot:QOY41924.1 hypothetical protein CPATCC_001512 [Cryptosporidium parvum]